MEIARRLADQRHNQKKGYKSCRQLSPNYELVGIMGEMIYAKISGESMDTRLLREGDDGYDFAGINVKTSEIHKAKHLIEYTHKVGSFKGDYVFIVVDLNKSAGKILGRISSEEFNSKSRTYDFGYGERKAIPLNLLR